MNVGLSDSPNFCFLVVVLFVGCSIYPIIFPGPPAEYKRGYNDGVAYARKEREGLPDNAIADPTLPFDLRSKSTEYQRGFITGYEMKMGKYLSYNRRSEYEHGQMYEAGYRAGLEHALDCREGLAYGESHLSFPFSSDLPDRPAEYRKGFMEGWAGEMDMHYVAPHIGPIR